MAFTFQHSSEYGTSSNSNNLISQNIEVNNPLLQRDIVSCFVSDNLRHKYPALEKQHFLGSVQKLANCTLRDLATKLDVHGRHCMLSYLSSLPISVLRSLDTEANKSYDRTNRLYDAALLTRCYTQHALRPVIDSKINHIRHFIKILFINKGMDFIDLPSIFRDKSVQSSIPNYFKNCEVPIICYKYNKPIRGDIFNFNKLVSDLNIETCTPDS